MAGYTRQSGNIQTGSVINADDFNNEYNSIEGAFAEDTGHTHDGSTGEGARILEIGPNGDLIVSATAVTTLTTDTLDLGSTTVQFKNIYVADDRAIQFGDTQDATLKYDETTTDRLLFGGANIRIANTNNILEFRDDTLSISSSADGQLDIDADTTLELDAPTIKLLGTAFTIGDGTAATDLVLTFDGETNDGVLTWMEDEDYFLFSDDILINGTEKLYFNDAGGEHIAGDGDNLTISAGTDLNLTATEDVNIPSDVGLTFGDDGEKIEGDGTDLTINSGNDLNLTATTDINIPANVGLTFGDDGEKIEGDGTDLTISSSNDLTFSVSNDATITSGNNITLTAPNDVIVSNDLRLQSDSAILSFGADDDIVLTHSADNGLTLSSVTAGTLLTLTTTDGDALSAPTIVLNRDSASAANDDSAGQIIFKADSDTQVSKNVSKFVTTLTDVRNNNFDSKIVISNIVDNVETNQIVIDDNGVTMNNGVNIDNITIDGTEIDLSSGDLTIDVEGDIILDSNGGDITLKDDGTTFANFKNNSGELLLQSGSTPTTAITFSGANIDLAGTLDVTGATTLDSTLDVTGTTTLSSTLDVTGAITGASYETSSGSLIVTDGTGTNAAGTTLTVKAGAGTGSGTGGSFIVQVAEAGSSGSSVNAHATALTIAEDKTATFAGDLTVSGTFSATIDSASISTNTISESTADNGVSVDSVVLKDGGATFTADLNIDGADIIHQGTSYNTTVTFTEPSSEDKTITVPGETTTLAGLAIAQEYTATQNFDATTVSSSSGVLAWDVSSNQVTSVTTSETITSITHSNQVDGGVYILRIIQGGTSYAIGGWASTFEFNGGTAPSITGTNSEHIIVFLSDGTRMLEIGNSINLAAV